MKPLAIFDIDGTIFRSSLMIELFKELVKQEVFSQAFYQRVKKTEAKWLNREGGYDSYLGEMVRAYEREVVGKSQKQITKVSRHVIRSQKKRVYRYTWALLNKLKKTHFLLAISGSPLEVVTEYNKFLRFDKVYGTEFGLDQKGRYTGKVLHVPPHYKKELIVRYAENHGFSLKRSIGIGDTESDIGLLSLVDKPVAFNPNSALAAHARRKGWKIIVERKDLIIEMDPKKVKFLKLS